MSLQDILKKFADDTAKKTGEIEAEIEKQKEEIRKEYVEKEKEEVNTQDKKTKKALDSVDAKIQSMARRENSKVLLDSKQKVIEKALAQLLERLEKADDAVYGKILKQLFAGITDASGKVLAPVNRVEVTKKYVPSDFEVSSSDKVEGGFIFQSGRMEVDNSFRNLILSEYRSDLTTYFAEQLKLV